MEPLKDENGLWYYPEQPPGTRVATMNDFRDIGKLIRKQTPYLILGHHWKVYQCYRVGKSFQVKFIQHWLEKGRVFVFEN